VTCGTRWSEIESDGIFKKCACGQKWEGERAKKVVGKVKETERDRELETENQCFFMTEAFRERGQDLERGHLSCVCVSERKREIATVKERGREKG
jgi:hypothetical protein